MIAYAGIGSREAPADICRKMSDLAYQLGELGFTLRSGAAAGADVAWETGLAPHHGRSIFLPWPGFNGHSSTLLPTPAAFAMAERFHPAWERCSRGARALHARNCQQVLGVALDAPIAFVACWTPQGSGAGGTGQALRIAKAHDIPVFDLGMGPPALQDLLDHADALVALRPGP